jgi:excisionase family DNA binding protein
LNKLLTGVEVAKLCDVRPSTIQRYARQGKLPSILVGNRRRFASADVVAWLTSHRVTEPAAR